MDFRVRAVLKHIEENFSDVSLSLSSVSASAGISPWYMSRIFKRDVGAGFREYLLTVRLSKAEGLLTSSTLSIKEVAARVGFKYTSDLHRHVRRLTGGPPSALRSAARASRP